MSSDNFFESFKEHTKVKLLLYQEYLKIYLSILSSLPDIEEIHVFDLFCGSGETESGECGSALLAFNLLVEFCRDRPSRVKYCLHLSDINQDYCDQLRTRVEGKKRPENLTPEVLCRSFQDFIKEPDCLSVLEKRTSKGVFFIDPFGYSDASPDDILKLKRNRNAEVFLFMPLTSMFRFINMHDVNLPLKKWKLFIGYGATYNNEFELAQCINSVFWGGRFYSGYFILRNQSCGSKYALLFISSNLLGLHKFNEIKWKLDPQEGFRMECDAANLIIPEVTENLFGTVIDKMKDDIVELVSQTPNGRISNIDLYRFIIRSGLLPKHFNDVNKHTPFLDVEYVKTGGRGTYLDYGYIQCGPKAFFTLRGGVE